MNKLNITWSQEGNKVFFKYQGKEIYFIMPKDYKLSETHPDLLKMAEWLMFSPWYDVLEGYEFSRKPGTEMGLNFSTGIDSTAAMILLPKETHLVYVEREGLEDYFLNQSNAIRMIENMDRKVIRVKTNFEAIRTFHSLQMGYSTAIGMGVPLILLADYLNLGKISYGKVFDDQFFPKGVFRNYTKDYLDRQELLRSVGLEGFYPTVGCSEVITTALVDNSIYKYLAFSCIRGEKGKQCNNCYKCFRKNLLRNKIAKMDGQTMASIQKNPPKMCTSLMFALNKSNIKVPILEYLNGVDVSMLKSIYYPAYDIYDSIERDWIINRLAQFGIKKMTNKEIKELKQLNFCRKEELSKNL